MWRNLQKIIRNTFEEKNGSFDPQYQIWIRQNEGNNREIHIFEYEPLISIILQIREKESASLQECVKHILQQSYANWELWLIVESLTEERSSKYLEKLVKSSKIFIKKVISNRKSAEVLNESMGKIRGDYLIFMDAFDLLASNALSEMVKLLNVYPEYDLIYSDEDRITPDSRKRHSPFFKPDWSPDTFLSFMYTGNFCLLRTSVARQTGFLWKKYDEADRYDFLLRFLELSKNDRVGHIQKILYHRIDSIDLKRIPEIPEEIRKIKEEMLQRRGIAGKTEPIPEMDEFRIVYDCPPETKVSIIIPSKDNVDILKRCIVSIQEQKTSVDYEIIVVDNGSTDENKAAIEAMEIEKGFRYYYEPMDFNFSRMCNIGAEKANGQILLFLNDDTEVISSYWLDRLAGQACQGHVGAVGAKMLYPDSDLIQHIGVTNLSVGPIHSFGGFPDEEIHYFGRNRLDYDLIAVTGACMMVEKRKFLDVGGFDEDFPVNYNDVDLCFRLFNAGYYNIVRNDVKLIHYESLSRGSDLLDELKMERLAGARERLYQKHPGFIDQDPFYNQNLGQDNNVCGLKISHEYKETFLQKITRKIKRKIIEA